MHSDIIRAIAQLEQQQHRPMRALALDPNDAESIARLKDIDAQIAELRRQLAPDPR